MGNIYIFITNKWITIFFKIDVRTAVKNLWTTPEVDVEVKGLETQEEEEPKQHVHIRHKPQKEVFHIRRNI